jgi:hypothetical protein
LLLSKEKQEEAAKAAGAPEATGIPEEEWPSARLTNRATSLQPHLNYSDTSKRTHNKKIEKRTTIKEGIQTLLPVRAVVEA